MNGGFHDGSAGSAGGGGGTAGSTRGACAPITGSARVTGSGSPSGSASENQSSTSSLRGAGVEVTAGCGAGGCSIGGEMCSAIDSVAGDGVTLPDGGGRATGES